MPIYDYYIKFKFRLFEGQKEKEDRVKIRTNSILSELDLISAIKKQYKYPGMREFKPHTIRIVKNMRTYFKTDEDLENEIKMQNQDKIKAKA